MNILSLLCLFSQLFVCCMASYASQADALMDIQKSHSPLSEITQKNDALYIISVSLGYVDISYIEMIVQKLQNVMRQEQDKESQFYKQAIQLRQEMLSLIRFKQEFCDKHNIRPNFKHPFNDKEVFLTGVRYMLSYIDLGKLSKFERLCTSYADSYDDEQMKVDFYDISDSIKMFIDLVNRLKNHVTSFINDAPESWIDVLDGGIEGNVVNHISDEQQIEIKLRDISADDIAKRWADLPNLSAAARVHRENAIEDLSQVISLQDLVDATLKNIEFLKKENGTSEALERCTRIIGANARRINQISTLTESMSVLDSVVNAYNGAMHNKDGQFQLPESTVTTVTEDIISEYIFDNAISSLELVKTTGKLPQGALSTSVTELIARLKDLQGEFTNADSNYTKKNVIEDAVSLYNEIIQKLQTNQSIKASEELTKQLKKIERDELLDATRCFN